MRQTLTSKLRTLASAAIVLQLILVTVPVVHATGSCESLTSDAAKKKCYVDQGQAKLQEAESKGEVKSAGKVKTSALSTLLVVGGLVSSGVFLMSRRGSCPGATSAMLIAGGSAAALAGEILSASQYKKKMKDAKGALEKISKGSEGQTATGSVAGNVNPTNVQAEAFDALIKQEEAVISAAKTKKKLYMLATAAYASAAVLAGLEVIKGTTNPAAVNCQTQGKDGDSPMDKADAASAEADKLEAAAAESGASDAAKQAAVEARANADRLYDAAADAAEAAEAAKAAAPVKGTGAVAPRSSRTQETVALRFLDNHFLGGQRVNFRSYLTDPRLASVENIGDLLAVQADRELLLNGVARSLSLDEYQESQDFLGASHVRFAPEEFSAIRVASVIAQQIGVSSAHATADAAAALAENAGPEIVVQGRRYVSGFVKLYSNPVTRLALAGVLTANNVYMLTKISKEEKKAKDRIGFLEKLKGQSTAAGATMATCAAGQACGDGSTTPTSPTGSTLASTSTESIAPMTAVSCITNTGSFDSACGCKKTNTCLNVARPVSASISGGASGISLGAIPATVDGVNSGSLNGGNIDSDAMASLATRMNKLKAALDAKNPALKSQSLQAAKIASDLKGGMAVRMANAPSGGSSGADQATDSLLSAKTPEEALENLKQEITKIESPTAPNTGTEVLNFDGVSDSAEAPIDDAALAQVMETGLSTGNSDINTDSSTNIFDIVSNRYRRSGMRRLYGIENTVPSEKANESDISK